MTEHLRVAGHMAANVAAVVVAGGRGLRAGGDLPKQYRELLGEPVLRLSVAALAEHSGISLVQAVIHQDDAALFKAASADLALLPPVCGGASRQASVCAGLEALEPHRPDVVLVHDAARPFLSDALITRAIAAGRESGAAVPVLAVAEAVKLAALSDVRTGFGFDVHRFGDGDHVMLGGVRISHRHGLSGHSDADVVLHALVDAILGALAEGDIGVHFPPTDPQWRDASSDRFLAFAAERVRARGGRIAHLDVTIVCEAPRIGPHRDAIRARIGEIAAVPIERVGLKATTSEKMGFTGRGEGMAAFANATVRLPWRERP